MNMSIFSNGFATDIFVRLAESLLHFVWQGGIIAVIVLIVDRCLRGHSAQLRYVIQVAALLLMLACVPVTYGVLQRQQQNDVMGNALEVSHDKLAASPVAVTDDSTLPAEKEPFAAIGSPEINRALPPQTPLVEQSLGQLHTSARFAAPYAAAAYLLGVALMFGRLALALMGGHRLCSDARPVTEPDLLSMVARQARKLGLRTAPVVAWCARTSVPLVAGLIKPMILLPVALASSLTPHQLEALLAHELAHLRRFDLLVNLLQRVAEALLFFHPAVWYVSRRISNERENCCDDSVLRAGWRRVEYADALVRMAEICNKLPGIGGVSAATILAADGNNPSQFKRRILRLLGEQESLRLGVSRGMAVAILGGILALILAIPVLFSAPSLVAQNEKDDSSQDTPAKNDSEPKNDREPEVLAGHYRVSFQETPWKEVLTWYGRVMGDRIDANIVPEGSFSYNSPRPLSHREISLLINRELLSRDYCLAAKDGGFSVQPAEVIARQYAEQLRKDFMHGYELKKRPDKFESYFELVECRIVGRTKPPAPTGPAISYVLKARRDFSAQEATSFFVACFADSGFPSVVTGESILADGFAVQQGGKWLGKTSPALHKGEQIEVWQNYAQEWNSRPPRDYRLVVRGLIVANGKPVAGARVQNLLLEGAPGGPEGEKLKSFLNWAYGGEPIVDDEGKFLVSINQYSQFVRNAYFHISAPGFAPQRVGPIAIDASKPAVDLKIELKPGFSGRLRLVLPDGKPLDKGEVELTVQDDLWAWSRPMASLPVGGDSITIPNCPAGPLLLKVWVPGFVEQEVRDVQFAEDKVTEIQVAPKPLEAKPKEVFYFRGKEALERIESVKPKWGESQHGIEFGIARLDDKRVLHSDERVRLEMFIRNTGNETVKVELAADFHANVPEIKDERGEAVKVEGIFLSGSVPLYQETLKPGEAFGFRHLGLGLGPRTWPPHWSEPKPGKYTLMHMHKIDVDPVDESMPGKGAMFTTGTIEFEVAATPAAKAPDAEVPKVVPKPQEKLYFRGKEALERIESVKPRWSQPQNDVEFGIARIDEKDRFYLGERVPLEMFVRNVGEKAVKIQLAADFLGNVLEVKNARGEGVKVETILLKGAVALYSESLKPGEAFGFRHLGLGLGPNPTRKEFWHPYWAEPTAGHATLRYTHEIEVAPADESKPGERLKFTSWTVHFDIAPADEAKPPRDGVHRYVPSPQQKDVVIEQNYKDGQLHGPSRTFNRGELDREENYKEGKLDGFSRSFREGKVATETIYKDGKPEGVTFSRFRMPDARGFKDFKMDGQYLNGKQEGTWTWELGGERVQVMTYKDGLLHGLWERKSYESQKRYRLTYDKGIIVGEGETLRAMPFLRKAAAQASGGDPRAKRMAAALQTDVDLEYFGTPAAEVVVDLGERFNMPMFLDLQATADAPGIRNTKIKTNLKQTKLFIGLHEMTVDRELVFDYRFNSLWLTTPKAAADWKDTTGVGDLKPAAGSPLAKALPELPKLDLLATPIAKLAEPFQKEYGITLDATRTRDAKWTGWRQPSLSFRDSFSILLYQNKCRCREEGGKLIIEPVGVPPKEKAEPAKDKPGAPAKVSAALESDPFEKPKAPNKVVPPPKPQDPKPRDGVHRIFDGSGKYLVTEQNYKDGQLHGPSLQFNSDGGVYVRQNYKEGKLDGFKRRYSDGKVVGETFYKDGKPEGVTFDTFGNFKKNGQYLNGKPEGVWTSERTGAWQLVKNYKDGLPDGLWERKRADGKRNLRLTFEKGMLVDKDDAYQKVPYLQKVSALAKSGKDLVAERALAMLEKDVDLEYPQTPAKEVVLDLSERFQVPMYLDNQATDVPGLPDKPITISEKSLQMFVGMHDLAAEHGLAFDYRFHAFWLTTPKAAAAWKDTTGVSDLKPAPGSPLAKALPELPKFDMPATPIAKLAELLQKEYGLTLDASRVKDAKWTGWPQLLRPEWRSLSFRDSLSILLYQNHCRCREEGGKLIIEPIGVLPKEKAEPAKEKPAAADHRVAPGTGLRINVPALGPAPLALDFAFPVKSKSTDPKQSFSFFFGVSRQ